MSIISGSAPELTHNYRPLYMAFATSSYDDPLVHIENDDAII